MKVSQLDALLYKAIFILSLASGYFFNIRFFEVAGFKLTFLTVSILIIFTLGVYLALKINFLHLLFSLFTLMFYLFISVENQGFETYGLIFFTNILIIYLLSHKPLDVNFLSTLGHIGILTGLAIFTYYVYEVFVYGEYVRSHKELWNASGHTFRFTMGSVFSFQGFSINPNVSITPFLVSFLMSETKKNSLFLSVIYMLFIVMVSIATNSRGVIVTVVFVFLVFLLARYSFKNIIKVFSIFSLSLLFIALILLPTEALDKQYSNSIIYFENISDKFERSTDEQRLEKINDSMEIFNNNLVFGGGFSIIKEKFDRSTENGYVEFLAVFGSVGALALFFAILLWFYNKKGCLNNELGWSLILIYLLINVFNTGYMHPINSLVLGLSAMLFNFKYRAMVVNINKKNMQEGSCVCKK